MLKKSEFERMQQELTDCNCTYEVKQLRRKGATGMAHSLFLHNANTKDLVVDEVERVAREYPNDRFHINFDGIARFSITVNDRLLMESDYYEVEDCYQISGMEFRGKLNQAMDSLT